ncbi:DUF2726 domain-containing protein [Pandoraea sputorum]|uniref:DUF2726 domain-containing protein n=1 Tax=Pandoraea sputorum TaxID=93222 RepID=A0A5E5BKB8_9BURK|nr:DUF2726 domain-containing protein [Pandoraea sputorum]VVE85475.1 hypothetical protein PSP31121_05265 [Pandoraea sputorum]
MAWGLLALLLLAVLFALAQKSKRTSRRSATALDPTAYVAVKPLTKTEQAFYRLLASSLPGHTILAQVDLKRIVRTKRGVAHHHFNRVAQLSLDFVICRADFSVVAAVELDDLSHDRQRQRTRDAKKDEVLKAVSVKLVRFDVRRYPSERDVRNAVLGTDSTAEKMSVAA